MTLIYQFVTDVLIYRYIMIFVLIIVSISISGQIGKKFNFLQMCLHDLLLFINWISKQSKSLHITSIQNLFLPLHVLLILL